MLKTMTISRVRVFAAGKYSGLLGLTIGLLLGTLGLVGVFLRMLIDEDPLGSVLDLIVAAGLAFVAGPIVLGVVAFFSGVVLAGVYNQVAIWLGGLTIELIDETED